jgi:plastocyanin
MTLSRSQGLWFASGFGPKERSLLMPIRSCSSVVAVLAALAIGACENKTAQPIAPSALQTRDGASWSAQVQNGAASAAEHAVTLFDACDPETFNAVLGAGTCVRQGGIRFEKFLEQLMSHHSAGAWHFAPSEVTMQVGQMLVANNRGGETHTFTEVEEFGGGNNAFINNLVGLTTVAPGCEQAVPLAAGASSSETEDEAGVEKYQCCIHPWMRAVVHVKEK